MQLQPSAINTVNSTSKHKLAWGMTRKSGTARLLTNLNMQPPVSTWERFTRKRTSWLENHLRGPLRYLMLIMASSRMKKDELNTLKAYWIAVEPEETLDFSAAPEELYIKLEFNRERELVKAISFLERNKAPMWMTSLKYFMMMVSLWENDFFVYTSWYGKLRILKQVLFYHCQRKAIFHIATATTVSASLIYQREYRILEGIFNHITSESERWGESVDKRKPNILQKKKGDLHPQHDRDQFHRLQGSFWFYKQGPHGKSYLSIESRQR